MKQRKWNCATKNLVIALAAGPAIGTSALAPGAIRESAAMQEAYETGRNL